MNRARLRQRERSDEAAIVIFSGDEFVAQFSTLEVPSSFEGEEARESEIGQRVVTWADERKRVRQPLDARGMHLAGIAGSLVAMMPAKGSCFECSLLPAGVPEKYLGRILGSIGLRMPRAEVDGFLARLREAGELDAAMALSFADRVLAIPTVILNRHPKRRVPLPDGRVEVRLPFEAAAAEVQKEA